MITAQAEHDSGSEGADLLIKQEKTRPTDTQQKANTPLRSRNEMSHPVTYEYSTECP
jgi:hypothetical protein